MDERKILYNQFLEDKKSYNLNVSYWRVKLQKALNEKFSRENYYIEERDITGKKFYDGNPIFSYYNLSKRKGLRIVQENPEELKNFKDIKLIEAWISSTNIQPNSSFDQTVKIEELVISLYLTHETVDKCMKLCRLWFFSNLSKEQLELY